MTRLAIVATHRLLHQGLDFRFVQRRGCQLDWTCDLTKQHFTLTDNELAELIADSEAKLYIPHVATAARPQPREAVADLSQVPPEELKAAQRRFDYVLDLHNEGAAYDAAAYLVEISLRKTQQRRGDVRCPNIRSTQRWIKDAGFPPSLAKLVAKTRNKGNRSDRLGVEERAIVEEMIDRHYLQRPPISVPDLAALIRAEINRRNEVRIPADLLKHVEEKAIQSSIDRRNKAVVEAARYGPARASAKFSRVDKQKDPKAPLDLVELDHTPADIFVLLPDGTARRPIIGTAIDRCTRMPWGLYVGFEPPSIHTLMQILKNGILPKTYVQKKVASGEWDIEHAWLAHGRPRAIRLDRALENLSEDCRLVAQSAGIAEIELCQGRRPQQKGSVESFLGNLNRNQLHKQPGTSFSNVIAKDDYDAEKNALITFPDLLWHLHKWFIDIFARDKHKGLRDIPYRLWNELTQRYPIDPIEDASELDCIFGRTKQAKLNREGILFKHIQYISDELITLLTSPEFLNSLPDDRKVTYRLDAGDLGEIRVYMPHVDRYLRVPCGPYWQDQVIGVSLWEHQATLNYVNRVMNETVNRDSLARARAALLLSNSKFAGPRGQGIGRYAPAGDRTETSPKQRPPGDQSGTASSNVVPIRSKKTRRTTNKKVAAAEAKGRPPLPGLVMLED